MSMFIVHQKILESLFSSLKRLRLPPSPFPQNTVWTKFCFLSPTYFPLTTTPRRGGGGLQDKLPSPPPPVSHLAHITSPNNGGGIVFLGRTTRFFPRKSRESYVDEFSVNILFLCAINMGKIQRFSAFLLLPELRRKKARADCCTTLELSP